MRLNKCDKEKILGLVVANKFNQSENAVVDRITILAKQHASTKYKAVYAAAEKANQIRTFFTETKYADILVTVIGGYSRHKSIRLSIPYNLPLNQQSTSGIFDDNILQRFHVIS